MLLEGEKGACWLRYEKMHDSMFHRAYKGLTGRAEEDLVEGEDIVEVSANADPGGACETKPRRVPNEANEPRKTKPTTVRRGVLAPSPLAWGGPGWGVAEPAPRGRVGGKVRRPPTRTLPHKEGGSKINTPRENEANLARKTKPASIPTPRPKRSQFRRGRGWSGASSSSRRHEPEAGGRDRGNGISGPEGGKSPDFRPMI